MEKVDARCSPEHECGSVCRDALPRPDVAGGLLLARRATARVVVAHALAVAQMREPRPGCSAFAGKRVDR